MSNKQPQMMDTGTMVLFGAIALVVLFVMFTPSPKSQVNTIQIPYNEFISQVTGDKVAKVYIADEVIYGRFEDGTQFKTIQPENDPQLMNDLLYHRVIVDVAEHESPNIFLSWIPTLLLIGVIIWFFRKQTSAMSGSGSKAATSDMIKAEDIGVTFSDVAGIDEAKHELEETIAFLKNPQAYSRLGGKMPTGILMSGPPGTGKTLLAKACAGEAKVPFFAKSGSDFVEKFVGVGASRVRELFEEAKKQAPCIIFIDEIDAVGKSRNAGMMSNDEREGTLNALLVEMDGFGSNLGIIVIAATNQPDSLDSALTRPGRFDRNVVVSLPDISGREQILKVHSKGLTIAEDFDYRSMARGCVGMSGADLANLMNEGALVATREEATTITEEHVEFAKDKIMMGAERKGFSMTEEEKECTAYHEAGHAIVGMTVPDHDEVHKVSIIPRGRALGVTMYMPDEDRLSYSKRRLLSSLASLMGGRMAEELINGSDNITTGASNDIERCTELARNMVELWGFSSLGPGNFAKDPNSYSDNRSEELKATIESEIKLLVDAAYDDAKKILTDKMDILHAMTGALTLFETINRTQVKALMNGESVGEE